MKIEKFMLALLGVALLSAGTAAEPNEKSSFQLSDINSDGQVTRAEIRELGKKHEIEARAAESKEEEAKIDAAYERTIDLETFLRLDVNDDLVLTLKEYNAMPEGEPLPLSESDHAELGTEIFENLCVIVGQVGTDSIDLELVSTGAIAQLKRGMKAAGKDIEKRIKASRENTLLIWIISISIYEKDADWMVSRREVQEFHTDVRRGLRTFAFHSKTQLRLAEMQSEAGIIFADLDGDGKLSKDESLKVKICDSDSFKESDKNKDGFVTKDELVTDSKSKFRDRFEKRSGSTDKFLRTDSDNDKVLHIDEVRKVERKWCTRKIDANTEYGFKAAKYEGQLYIDMKTFLTADADDDLSLTRKEYDSYERDMKLSEADCKVLGEEYIVKINSSMGIEDAKVVDLAGMIKRGTERSKNDLLQLKEKPEEREKINYAILDMIREISAADTNGDLKVTAKEIANSFAANGAIGRHDKAHENTQALIIEAMVDHWMLIMDINEDGQIGKEEDKLMKNLNFMKCDKDDSGTVSRSEMIEYHSRKQGRNRDNSGK
ncbi:MAG: hypothetical protein V3V10_00140 [Planctomycetota bacterium]